VEFAVSRLSRTVVIVSLLALTGLLDLTLATGSFGADLSLVPRRSIIHLPASNGAAKADTDKAELRLEEFAKGPNAACTAWTDGCRSCGKGPDGVFCSNVGIACQRSAPRCSSP
jgi:hypothetical protein